MSLVLDASMALAWCMSRANPEEATLAGLVLAEVELRGAHVPALWYAEIANTLLVFERAQRINPQGSQSYLSDLNRLSIKQDETPALQLQPQTLTAARTFRLTAYDAAYLELAQRRKIPLATLDRKLAEACRAAGVTVFGDLM